MKRFEKFDSVASVLSFPIGLLAIGVLAIGLAAPATAQDAGEVEAVRRILVVAFDKPEAHLAADPIVVQDDAAVAGWSQAELGGRALLRRKGGAWSIVLCAGDSLKDAATLESLGVAKATAEALAAELARAERAVDPARLALFSRFDGMVEMEAGGAHRPVDPHHLREP